MKTLRITIIFAGLLMGFILQPLAGAQSVSSFDKEKMDSYLNKLEQKDKFMGSLAIDSAGQQVYSYSAGYRRPGDKKAKADAQTIYRIGSVTKTFTATMIMQLIEEGKLSLSTKLTTFYPEIPQADRITIEHMLRHQSGLYNFTNAPDYPEWMTEKRSKEQMLELFRKREAEFNPGSKTKYSNTNYVLLGYIIEDITGESYAVQLQKRIVEPLDLNHTHYGDGIDPEKGEAVSFRYAQSEWSAMPETDMSIPGGAGAIVSTPDELTDFIRALFEGKLVSEESLDKMTTINQGLGIGLMKIPFDNFYAYGHNGGIDGFQSNLSYFPQREVAFAFTGNGLNYSMNNILIGTWSIYFEKPFEIPSLDTKTISLTLDQMQKYVGSFTSSQLPMDFEVFVEDSTLKGQASGQSSFPLAAENKTTLRFDRAGVVIEFDSLRDGKYQKFTLSQGGGTYEFSRK